MLTDVLSPHRLTVQYRPAEQGGPRQHPGLRFTSTFGAGLELREIIGNRVLQHAATITVSTLTACCMGYPDRSLGLGIWCSECGKDSPDRYMVPVLENRDAGWCTLLAQQLEGRAATVNAGLDPLALTLMVQMFLSAAERYFAVLPHDYPTFSTTTFPLVHQDG